MVKYRLALFILSMAALANLLFLFCCIQFTQQTPAADYFIKQTAVDTAIKAAQLLGDRLQGPEYSEITTTLGPFEAKRLSRHPDFAAVAVHLLREAGVQAGDRVAVNLSGSFPALNIAVLAAIQALDAQPVVTSSVGASTWGATNPSDTWLDMEHSLHQAGVLTCRSQAASIGGAADRGGGLTKEGVNLARQAILRNGVPELNSRSLNEAIEMRLNIYRSATGSLPAALVNVGGSHVIFGSHGHDVPSLKQGLTTGYQPHPLPEGNLAAPFRQNNRPVLHFINIRRLAALYGIEPEQPSGSARIFFRSAVSPVLRLAILSWISLTFAVLFYGNRKGWWQGPCV